ncbi:PREDICTED: monothiol glutaredoxin-S2-like [Nelumbo nucifera]|uniref:Glutaredoxin domain-containing protein n=2 Tax=Nelumbo nucifera TaxID=4432 RepID=A0A822ZUC6_NELNU|nr:PREDICTED: monothiol glutaredoxin-S2-like [Nelumbo nucifera]DAD48160.1 TPA_asm: hypothetical protein HUJ06_018097 [Nelumbo nucifera]
MDRVIGLAKYAPVVIFSKSSCCMCHTVKTLFYEYGANPTIFELDLDPRGREMERALLRLGCSPSVPTVFIGGRLIGGTNEVMTRQLGQSPSLREMLIDARAIHL